MRTIKNAHCNNKRVRGLVHCPATRLAARQAGEASPIRENSDLAIHSPSHYEGFFHTDHLIPSVFFKKERDQKELKLYDDLSFQYIYDPIGDPQDHRELMIGTEAMAFEVKRNMDRLPEFFDPEKQLNLTGKLHGRVGNWLSSRLQQRLDT
jgi:hypothetical protein